MTEKMLKRKVKKHRFRNFFLFATLVAVILFSAKTDIKRLIYIDVQTDTIAAKDLTIEQLEKRVENITFILEDKETELEDLKNKFNKLNQILDEKKGIVPVDNFVDSLSIDTSPEGDVIKIGE